MHRFGALVAVLLFGLAGFVAWPRAAAAHPLGTFTVSRYAAIGLYSDQVRVTYIVDFAELPTYQVVMAADDDHDGAVSDVEGAGYARIAAEAFVRSMSLTMNGHAGPLGILGSHFAMVPGQGGLPTVRLEITYGAPVVDSGIVAMSFEDRNDQGAGWKEIVVRPSPGAKVTAEPELLIDRSDALRSYPINDLSAAPDMRSASFYWVAGSGEPAPLLPIEASPPSPQSQSGGDALTALIRHDGSFWLIVLAMLAAFGFGSLHALGPGHGKTVVASYLVGSRGTFKHAVVLGYTTTATHTASVYLLGFVTIAASAWIVPSTLYLYLSVGSGALVVATGFALFIGRVRRRGGDSHGAGGPHRHGRFGRTHSHGPAIESERAHAPADGAHPHQHGGGRDHTPEAAGISWRSLIALGIAGGMLPCPSAIVVMLAAIAIGKVAFGLLLIVAFSLGLATVLTTLGVLVVAGQRLASRSTLMRAARYPAVRRLVAAMPAVSALGVMLAGVAITVLALRQPGL